MLVFKARPRKSPNLADDITPSQRRIMRLLADARDRVQDSIVLRDLEDLIEHRSTQTIANAVTTEPWLAMQQALADELHTEVIDSGRRVKLPRIEKAVLSYRFDADRPEARQWAEKEAANLIREISAEQREVIREVVVRSQGGEFTVAQVARQVRGTIGLTSRQAQWVENFRQRKIDEARDRGVSAERAPEVVQSEVDRYHKRIHRYRSETIARTETIRASSEGRREAWQQGMDEGFISPEAEKRWIVEYDGCQICMNNGLLAFIPIMDEFPTGDPPAHPNCRCDVILRDDPVDDLTEMSDEELAAEIDSLIEASPAVEPGMDQRAESGDLPKWARDAGVDSLLAELPEDRSRIGYRTETEADMIRRWENEHSGDSRDIEQIREDGRLAREFMEDVAPLLEEDIAANQERIREMEAKEGILSDSDRILLDTLRRNVSQNLSDINFERAKVQRLDRVERTLAQEKERITDWRETLDPVEVLDIDPGTGAPGATLRRQLKAVEDIGGAVESEVQRRLPRNLQGSVKDKYAAGSITDDDLRTISRTREEVLAELRPMDEGQDNFQPVREDDLQAMRNLYRRDDVYYAGEKEMDSVSDALNVYPTQWIDRMASNQGRISIFRTDRGFSDPSFNVIATSGTTDASLLSTTQHEVGHRMEMSTPGLNTLQWAYLTSDKRPGQMTLAQIPNAPEGEFYLAQANVSHPYTARIYEPSPSVTMEKLRGERPRDNLSFEVFTTGTQAAFPRMGSDLRLLDRDGRLATWTLGLLASL